MQKELEQLLSDVKTSLAETTGPIKQIAEKALKASETGETMGAEIKQQADKLLQAQGALSEAQTKITERLETLETSNSELSQKLLARGSGGKQIRQTLGQAFVADDKVKSFMSAGKGSVSVTINNAITSGTAPAIPDQETEVVGLPKRQMRIRQLLTNSRMGSSSIKYRKQTVRTINAAARAEGDPSVESVLEWANADAIARTLSHHVNVSKESYADADFLAGEIDGDLLYGLDLKEDLQLLAGDGLGENLSGLVTNATAYVASFVPDGTPTILDTLRLAYLQATLSDYMADGVVLNPIDLAYIELLKDANNRFIFANPQEEIGPRLWGRPVVETKAIDVDKFLVGAFRAAGTIYDRSQTDVLISSEHGTNFIEGMLTIQAEKRLALAVKRPAALVYGDLGRVA